MPNFSWAESSVPNDHVEKLLTPQPKFGDYDLALWWLCTFGKERVIAYDPMSKTSAEQTAEIFDWGTDGVLKSLSNSDLQNELFDTGDAYEAKASEVAVNERIRATLKSRARRFRDKIAPEKVLSQLVAAYKRLEGINGLPAGTRLAEVEELNAVRRYMGTRDGVIDLRSGDKVEAAYMKKENIYVTKRVNAAYDKRAKSDKLDWLFGHLGEDERRWLLEAMGASLQGSGRNQSKVDFIIFLVGPANGGKSTLLEIYMKLLGSEKGYSITMPDIVYESKQSYTDSPQPSYVKLEGPRIAIKSEWKQNKRPSEDMRNIASGDVMGERRTLFSNPRDRELQPTCVPWISCNDEYLPNIDLSDDSWKRRVKFLPYPMLPHRADQVRERFMNDEDARNNLFTILVDECARTWRDGMSDDLPSMEKRMEEAEKERLGGLAEWMDSRLEIVPEGMKGEKNQVFLTAEAVSSELKQHDAYSSMKSSIWDHPLENVTKIISKRYTSDGKTARRSGKRGWYGIALIKCATCEAPEKLEGWNSCEKCVNAARERGDL